MGPKILKRVINYEKVSYIHEGSDVFPNKNEVIDCALGTNPFGYSTMIGGDNGEVKLLDVNTYPGYPYTQLKETIRDYWLDTIKLDSKRIVIGSGTMGLLIGINKLFVDEHATVLGYCPQFTDYISNVRSLGGHYEYILLKENQGLKIDIREIIDALDEKQSLVYVDNPNNPTGQIIPLDDLRMLAQEAEKKGICVIVDEAYGDFMEKENSALNIVDEFDNIFVLRSLSKGFGLAGIRVGYMVCSRALQAYYQKIDIPFSVTNYGESIAKIALKDPVFVKNSMKKIIEMKKRILAISTKLEIMQTDVSVPIMVVRHSDEAVDLYKELLKYNVLTESGNDFIGLGKNSVRMRIPKEVEPLIEVLEKIQ